MLDQLQPDQVALWGGLEPQGSVLSCDFYNAGAIQTLSDEAVRCLVPPSLPPAPFLRVCLCVCERQREYIYAT